MIDNKYADKGTELTDKQLESVAGGLIHFNIRANNYEVVDFEGQVVGVFDSMKEAMDHSIELGLGAGEINDSQLAKMRAGDSILGGPVDWQFPVA